MTSANAVLVSAVYWRKNPFLAAMMVPLVITLVDGRFTAIGPDGKAVFDVAAKGLDGTLGAMGTLKTRIDGRKYAIVGRGSLGRTEKGYTEQQREFVRQFLGRYPQAATTTHLPGGPVDALFNGSAAAKLHAWQVALNGNGARIRGAFRRR